MSAAASLERDSGFNSGSSEHEDDLKSLDQSSRDGLITPENSSEDSVEVKLPQAIVKNKRKSTEPLRVISDSDLLGPIKKRIRFEEQLKQEKEILDQHHAGGNPFRPWAPSSGHLPLPAHFPSPADLTVRHPGVTTLHRAISIKPLDQLQQPSPIPSPESDLTIGMFVAVLERCEGEDEVNEVYLAHEKQKDSYEKLARIGKDGGGKEKGKRRRKQEVGGEEEEGSQAAPEESVNEDEPSKKKKKKKSKELVEEENQQAEEVAEAQQEESSLKKKKKKNKKVESAVEEQDVAMPEDCTQDDDDKISKKKKRKNKNKEVEEPEVVPEESTVDEQDVSSVKKKKKKKNKDKSVEEIVE